MPHPLAKLRMGDDPAAASRQPSEDEHDTQRNHNEEERRRIIQDHVVHRSHQAHATDHSQPPSSVEGRDIGDLKQILRSRVHKRIGNPPCGGLPVLEANEERVRDILGRHRSLATRGE